MAGGSTKAVVTALIANMTIAVMKFVSFLLTGSSSMLPEPVHSVADSSNQGLLLIGGKRAKRDASPEHPFGYGRERYVYSFLVAIVLFSVGGLFALYEAYHKWQDPHPIEGFWWWLPPVVLIGAIIAEGFALRTAIVESNRVRGKQSWVQFVRKAKSPELPVILLEDTGAIVGLFFALIGVSLTLITGDSIWDALGTMMIGLLLVIIAIILAIEMKSLLLGESATKEHIQTIREAITAGHGTQIVHLKTLHLGPERLLVAAKIAIGHSDSGKDVAEEIDAAEQRIRAAVDLTCVVYLEPAIYSAKVAAAGDDDSAGNVPE